MANPAYFLNTQLAVPGAQLRIKSTTLDFIQSSYQFTDSVLASSLIGYMSNLPIPGVFVGGDLSLTVPYVLGGMQIFSVFGIPVNPLGWVYYGGQVYKCTQAPGLAYPPGFTASLYATFSVANNYSSYGNNADPASFTNGSLANVHNITTIVFGTNSTGALFPYNALQFMTAVPQQITNNNTSYVTPTIAAATASIYANGTTNVWSSISSFGTGWSAGTSPRVAKEALTGRVFCSGNVQFSGSTSNLLICTLPFAPVTTYEMVAWAEVVSGPSVGLRKAFFMAVQAGTGQVIVDNYTPSQLSTSLVVDLGAISFQVW